jgi:shikimate kinase
MTEAGKHGALGPIAEIAGGWRQVHLVGFMGAGKSTVARGLARRLLWNYLDLDVLVARHAGASVAQIFRRQGEPAFREYERFALRQAVQKPHSVVALGGGTFVDERNVAVSRRHAVSVWLQCTPEEVRRRLSARHEDRPLWDPATVAPLLAERSIAYSRADVHVAANGDPDAVVERVRVALERARVPEHRPTEGPQPSP